MDQTELDILKGSEEIMNKEQMNKYSYELMVKNNSDEAIKNLLLKDKEIERLTELCNKYEEEHKTTFETWQKDIKENEHLRTALNSKESIIKEVREYIDYYGITPDQNDDVMVRNILKGILEILKGSDKE